MISQEFPSFLSKNGVQYLNTPPFHPSSNGLAVRAVRSFKELFKKHTEGDFSVHFARVVFAMRTVICSVTNQTPMDLFYSNLKLGTPLDIVRPTCKVQQVSESVNSNRKFVIGYNIRFRDYRRDIPGWSLGLIKEFMRSRLYRVQDENDTLRV